MQKSYTLFLSQLIQKTNLRLLSTYLRQDYSRLTMYKHPPSLKPRRECSKYWFYREYKRLASFATAL